MFWTRFEWAKQSKCHIQDPRKHEQRITQPWLLPDLSQQPAKTKRSPLPDQTRSPKHVQKHPKLKLTRLRNQQKSQFRPPNRIPWLAPLHLSQPCGQLSAFDPVVEEARLDLHRLREQTMDSERRLCVAALEGQCYQRHVQVDRRGQEINKQA